MAVIWTMATRAGGDPDLPGVTPNLQTIPAGSLVIPMCTNLQALAGTPFNMKAYGLVNALLHTNIPVKWAIAVGKAKDGIDFTGSASRILPTTNSVSTTSFRSGPFIIHRDYTNQAMSIITNWDNKVAVYRLTADTTVDVRYTLCHKPRVAVLDDGNTQTIQTSILDEAGVPTSHYIVLHAADVAFLASSDCYTLVTSPHFVTGATTTNQTHSIRDFVMNGGNFLAQCAAVSTYEDNPLFGFFQTTKGVTIDNKASSFVYRNADMAFNQFQGDLAAEGGHTAEWDLSTGSSFANHAYVGVLNASNTNNIRSAVAKLFPGKPGSVVFYLGGHDFAGNGLTDYNGRRMYLNALFVPPDRPAGCVIVFQTDLSASITNNLSGVTNGQHITYTIVVTNSGPGRVVGASVTDVFPSTLQNVTWTSVTNGGATIDSIAGSGNINSTVSMPILSSIIYTVSATVSPAATTSIIDTVSVSLPVGMTDQTPSNNVASITNALAVPTLTLSCPASTAQQGTPYLSALPASGGLPPYTFSIAAGSLPPGLTLATSTGVISGTPTAFGAFNFTAKVTDSRGVSAVAACNSGCSSLTNNWILTSPSGKLSASQSYTANGMTVTAYGYNTNGTTHALYAKTDGGDENGLGLDGTFDFEIGNSNFVQLDISQLIAANAQNVSIAIGSVQPGEAYNIYGSHTQGALGTLLLTNGNLDNTFFTLPGYPNYEYISVKAAVADVLVAGLTAIYNPCSIAVVPPPNPTAFPDRYTVNANNQLVVNGPGILANDTDPGNRPLQAVLTSTTSHGTLSLNSNGGFTYTPAANFAGTDTFSYVATNGLAASQPVLVTIDVLLLSAPRDVTLSCAASVPSPANNLAEFIAQGGLASSPYCGQPTTVTFIGDSSNGGSGCPASPLVITRTYKLVTGCGDTTNVVQKITVVDTTVPVITGFPADATYSCASLVPAADNNSVTATDNCSSIVVTHDADVVVTGSCANRYSITRTYRVSDSCGNSTSRTQHITVNDETAPTIVNFPADATYSCANAVPAANNALVTATDACSGSVTITHDDDVVTSSNCVNRLTITRTYRATDGCGNSTSKTQTITVNGTTAPTITTFPADATASCAGDVPQANDLLVTATNACGDTFGMTITHDADVITSSNCVNRFTITRTYTATDSCGNSTTRAQTFTVNATTAPTIATFPADATYLCASAVPAANDSLVTATDGCGTAIGITITHNTDVIGSSNCVSRFTITRTYVATDACGNSSSKSQIITVNATNAPAITTFPADATYSCSSAVPAADDKQVAATDSCGGSAPVTISHLADVITSSNCVSRFNIARTYIATDACGNSSSKTQTITVDNTTPPQITGFPSSASYSCASLVPLANDNLVTAIDNCGGLPTVTHDTDLITASNCLNHFTITRTYRVTDACGNSTSRSQTITVNDTRAPSFRAPLPSFEINVSCASDIPAADDSIVHAEDNCGGGVTVTHDSDVLVSSNCVSRFTLRRVYHVADSCGNSTNFTQTIHVNSTTAPTITVFPADATYTCSAAVPPADDSVVTATDGCGIGQVHISHGADAISSTTCDNRYVIQRTYTAVDACGNSSSKTQSITINNTTPPTITQFPNDATFSCASAVPPANDSLVAATNACGDKFGMVITHGADVISSSNCVNHFTIARPYTATDSCGNATTRTQTITVNAVAAPTITVFPSDATYQCGSQVPPANYTQVSATDSCGGSAPVTISHLNDVVSSSNCLSRFTVSRTYIATDACGNSASRTQTITIDNTTPPQIVSFPANASYTCANLVPPPNDSLITAVDNCGALPTVTHSNDLITESNCPNRFTITRTYRVTDACGNSTSRSQIITVNDNRAPGFVLPVPSFEVNVSCASEVPPADDSIIHAEDNCGGRVIVSHQADVVVSSNCVSRFTLRRIYHISDSCGNVTNFTQTIHVNSTTAPTITVFPVDATYTCASAVPSPDDNLVTAIDGCGTGQVHILHSPDAISSATCDNRFVIRRTYTAVDSCGNSASKTQTITINNTTPPAITQFPSDATYSCIGNVPPANDSLVTATNACGDKFGMIITHAADVISSSNCVNRLTILRTYTATDNCGNSTTRTQTITVNATTPPTITTFPADATYSCPGAVPAANDSLVAAVDGCGANSLVITHGADVVTSSNCVGRFTITRTYTATDACGNSSSKTQTITVNATTPPTITTFPADATYSCSNGVPAANNTLVSATDGCGGNSLIITHSADVITASNCVNRFTISRTYTATDACGNSASKTQTIIVNGTTPPTITTFPSDVTFACAGSVPPADNALVRAVDNCGAAAVNVTHDSDVIVSNICVNRFIIQRTYHVTDACGNSTAKTQTITVNDNIAPEISCPPGFTVSLFDDVPGPNFELVIATDNCGVPIKTLLGQTYATNNNIVTITRVFAATDDCGNSSTCSQAITVNPYLATGTANPDSYSTFENQTLNVAAPGVLANDTDPNNLPLQPILVATTTNGTLTLNPNGSFRYVPNANFVGHDAFIYQASNGGTTTAPVVVSINVAFVNQPPSFAKGPNQIVHNYQQAQTRTGWASNISAGPANESSQTVQFIVSNDNNSIFTVQPFISPNGTLSYAPAAGHYGIANVSVKIKDNGGTANGGIDTSDTQAFTIIVNNPPSATINTPTNTSLFLYPSPVDIVATATDIDGTVASVIFLNGTNVIGQGTPAGNNTYTMTWTNAPATNSVLYALATDNYGATNLSPPINIQLGNPVLVTGGPIGFSPSLFSWAQSFSVTNPTISVVQSVTITFTSVGPAGTSIVGVTGTNELGQPYITINNTVPPVTGIANYATILFVASSKPTVTVTTTASLSPGPGFTVSANTLVPITRRQFQNDGSFLLNFTSASNHVYFVQYTKDFKTWFTSPIPLHGTGTTMQWADIGPSVTESNPKSVPYRFYRVVYQ